MDVFTHPLEFDSEIGVFFEDTDTMSYFKHLRGLYCPLCQIDLDNERRARQSKLPLSNDKKVCCFCQLCVYVYVFGQLCMCACVFFKHFCKKMDFFFVFFLFCFFICFLVVVLQAVKAITKIR